MLTNFRTYQLALELYRQCEDITMPRYLRDQLLRAASSICLNLAEGSAKPTKKDRLRFYYIAFGSLREVQGLVDLQPEKLQNLNEISDQLGAYFYRLVHA